MAPGDISPYFNSKVTCEGLTTTGAQAKYQDFFCGDDNHGNRVRLIRDLSVDDDTSPEGKDKLRRHQAWYNDKKRKERGGNLRFKVIAQGKLDENDWPDEEEEEEEEEEEVEEEQGGLGQGQGQGQGLGLGQNNDNGEEGAGDDVIIIDGIDEAVEIGLAADNPAPAIVNGNDGGHRPDVVAPDSVAIAAMEAHTRILRHVTSSNLCIMRDVTSKNQKAGQLATNMIDRTYRKSRGTSTGTSVPSIAPVLTILFLVLAAFLGGCQTAFRTNANRDAYPVGSATISSASNAQRLSSFNDFEFAVIEKIVNAGSETLALINNINVDVLESLMEIYRKRSAQPRSTSFEKEDGSSGLPRDSVDAPNSSVGKASENAAVENRPPSSTPSSTSSGTSGPTVLSSTPEMGLEDDRKESSIAAADEIRPASTSASRSDGTGIGGASIIVNDNKVAECETVSNATNVSANATVPKDPSASSSGGHAADSRSQNVSPDDNESSLPMDKGEIPSSSSTTPGSPIPQKNPPLSAPPAIVPHTDLSRDSTAATITTTNGLMAGDEDVVEGPGGNGRNSDPKTHKRMGFVGMAARAIGQYPMVLTAAAIFAALCFVEWFYGIDIGSLFDSIGNPERLEVARQEQEAQLDDVLRQLNG